MVQRRIGPPSPPYPMVSPPPPLWFTVVWVPSPCRYGHRMVGCARWLGARLLRVWTLGCDTVPLNSDLP